MHRTANFTDFATTTTKTDNVMLGVEPGRVENDRGVDAAVQLLWR